MVWSGEVVVSRHSPDLPRFIILPFDPAEMWGKTALFTADGELNGAVFSRRSVKPLNTQGAGDGRWWIDLPGPLCAAAGVDTGDTARLTLSPGSEAPPEELATLLAADAALQTAWDSWPVAHRREWSRWVEEAKRPATRLARAERVTHMITDKSR